MNDYRIFVGAMIEGELSERIQAIRRKYDPVTARITPPHVTVAGTYWRSGPATPENEAEAIQKLEIIPGILPPFELVLGGVRTFPGDRPIVYLGVEVTKGLIEARNLSLSMLGNDKHRDYKPHLTLAMRLPWKKAWEMVNELQASEWNTEQFAAPIHELCLLQRAQQDRAWRIIHRVKL